MIHATVNEKQTFDIEKTSNGGAWTLNNSPVNLDILEVENNRFHIIRDSVSYNAEVLLVNREQKQVTLKVNGNEYTVQLKDRFDDLLKSLGMESSAITKLKEVKAPMPGMVLQILVSPEQEVEKDSALLILEAMKMENVIKSPAAGKVKRISIEKGVAVEKNTVLIEFYS